MNMPGSTVLPREPSKTIRHAEPKPIGEEESQLNPWKDASEEEWSDWRWQLRNRITKAEQLKLLLNLSRAEVEAIEVSKGRLATAITPYFAKLMSRSDSNCPIRRQAIPTMEEFHVSPHDLLDPCAEDENSPVRGVVHRYPDRVLFLVSSRCAMYCRFCNRKRKVGRASMVTRETIREGLSYIRNARKVRDVLLSGGDPLLLQDGELHHILTELRSMSHVEIIRIGTRVPCTLPQRITPQLTKMLKAFHPLYINTHFNHPSEVTKEAALACSMLADAGFPLGCQTVLLKGVNDDPGVMKELMHNLLSIRVRPYYLFQADLAKGTSHFWTPLSRGIEIIEKLQGHTSGLCVPRYMIDIPGGGGKIPLVPDYVMGSRGHELLLRNYKGEEYRYPMVSRGGRRDGEGNDY